MLKHTSCTYNTRFPFLRYLVTPDDQLVGGAGGQANGENAGGEGQENDLGYPQGVPVKDMTPEQQAAFHQAKGRRLEDRLKAFDGIRPEDIEAMRQELTTLRQSQQTAEERQLEQAREEGRAEIRSQLASERVNAALERAFQGRAIEPMALITLDRTQFIKGDQADADAIATWVENNSEPAPAPAQQQQQKPLFPHLGQGQREQVQKSERELGEAEAARRYGQKTT